MKKSTILILSVYAIVTSTLVMLVLRDIDNLAAFFCMIIISTLGSVILYLLEYKNKGNSDKEV